MTVTLPGSVMTAEKVLAGLLEPGDVICVQHHHDSRCGECLAPWQTQAVITGRPAPVSGRLAVNWAVGTRPPGARGAITGVSVFSPDEQVVRIGRPPAARPGALALMPGAAARPTPGHRSWLARGVGVPHIAAVRRGNLVHARGSRSGASVSYRSSGSR